MHYIVDGHWQADAWLDLKDTGTENEDQGLHVRRNTRESAKSAIVCDTPPHVRVPKAQSYVTRQSLHDRAGTFASKLLKWEILKCGFYSSSHIKTLYYSKHRLLSYRYIANKKQKHNMH